MDDAACGRDGGVRGGEDPVSLADVECAEGEMDRVCAVRDSDRVSRAEVVRELELELRALDEPPARQHARDGRVEFRPEGGDLRAQIGDEEELRRLAHVRYGSRRSR